MTDQFYRQIQNGLKKTFDVENFVCIIMVGKYTLDNFRIKDDTFCYILRFH